MEITNIRFYPLKNRKNPLAIFDVEFDGKILIKGFRLILTSNGKVISMPQIKSANGYKDIVSILDSELMDKLRLIMIRKWENYIISEKMKSNVT